MQEGLSQILLKPILATGTLHMTTNTACTTKPLLARMLKPRIAAGNPTPITFSIVEDMAICRTVGERPLYVKPEPASQEFLLSVVLLFDKGGIHIFGD